MSCSIAPNCTGWPFHCPKAAPDPDVVGIGVVWGFGLTALITVLLSSPIMLIQIFEWLEKRQGWVASLKRAMHLSTPQQQSKWKNTLVHFILGLSDQQLVTGLAILIVGFTKHCSIASFHFWVIFDLAWFSAVTHLASLRTLQHYLREYPRWRNLRVALMLATLAMVYVAAILTFGNYDLKTHNCPIQCAFDRVSQPGFPVSGLHMAQIILLTLGFGWALAPLYASFQSLKIREEVLLKYDDDHADEELQRLARDRSNQMSISMQEHGTRHDSINNVVHMRSWRIKLLERLVTINKKYKNDSSYKVIRFVVLFLWDPPAPLIWLMLAAMWVMGAVRLIEDRHWTVAEENVWSFGQVLPMLLLVLPLFTVAEVWQEEYSRTALPPKPLELDTKYTSVTDHAIAQSPVSTPVLDPTIAPIHRNQTAPP